MARALVVSAVFFLCCGSPPNQPDAGTGGGGGTAGGSGGASGGSAGGAAGGDAGGAGGGGGGSAGGTAGSGGGSAGGGTGGGTGGGAGGGASGGAGGGTAGGAGGGVSTTPSLSIGDAMVTEGNSAPSTATFTVTLAAPSTATVFVSYTTADGTASELSDYQPTAGTLTFAPGETSKTVTVTVTNDLLDEPDETFAVQLFDAIGGGASLADASGAGTITNDDVAPALSIADATIEEGATGLRQLNFPVTLSAPSGRAVTVSFATADGTASVAGSDYHAQSGTLLFAPGETTRTLLVPITGDTVDEPNETFTLTLSAPMGATLADGLATGTITDDDLPPLASITSVTRLEGGAGAMTMVPFTISLNEASAQTVTVDWATAAGTATAGTDFTAANGTVTFAPGELTKTINVVVLGDTTAETNETFSVVLSNPVNAGLGLSQGIATVSNDDGATLPLATLSGGTVVEGNAGTKALAFTVTLSAASTSATSINYQTEDGTALAGTDYSAITNVLLMPIGATTGTINVIINGDAIDEPDESFTVRLTGITANAAIAQDVATGTITNDDTQPSVGIAVATVAVNEGAAGDARSRFTVTLSGPSGRPVRVQYATADGTAASTGPAPDFAAASGTLLFPPGVTSQLLPINAWSDLIDEVNETATVTLSAPMNATLGATATGTLTITDDDAVPALSVSDAAALEGTGGTTDLVFTVTLAGATSRQVTVAYSTSNGTAVSPADYTAATNVVLTFAPGEQVKTIIVPVAGDATLEANETFGLTLTTPVNATIADSIALATLYDDDGTLPHLNAGPLTAAEGSGMPALLVTLSSPSTTAVTGTRATVAGTAVSPGDYTASSSTFSIPAGMQSLTVPVSFVDDMTDELHETLTVDLTLPTGAAIGRARGPVRIADDDPLPSVSVANVSLAEGNTGSTQFQFTVTLSAASGRTVTVDFHTAEGTTTLEGAPATGGADFTATSGTLTFAPGITSQTVNVSVAGDTANEADETFSFVLEHPTGATLGNRVATGLVMNDDALPTLTMNTVTLPEGNATLKPFVFTVTMTPGAGRPVSVNWATGGGTATAGTDYVAASGSLFFPPGTISRTVTVWVIGDSTLEAAETFQVNLTGVMNAQPAMVQATGTINNDD